MFFCNSLVNRLEASGCFETNSLGSLVYDEDTGLPTYVGWGANNKSDKQLQNAISQLKEYGKKGKLYQQDPKTYAKYREYQRYAWVADVADDDSRLLRVAEEIVMGQRKNVIENSLSLYAEDEDSPFKDWIQYSAEEILEMYNSGVIIPDEVVDWAKTMVDHDTLVEILGEDETENSDNGLELDSKRELVKELTDKSNSMIEATEAKQLEFDNYVQDVKAIQAKRENASDSVTLDSTNESLEDLVMLMDELANDIESGFVLSKDIIDESETLAILETGANPSSDKDLQIGNMGETRSILYNTESIAGHGYATGSNLNNFMGSLANTIALNEYTTLYDFAKENIVQTNEKDEISQEIDNEIAESISVETSTEEEVASTETEPDDGLTDAQKTRQQMQSDNVPLSEQAEYFAGLSMEKGVEAKKDNFVTFFMEREAQKEAKQAQFIAALAEMLLQKKHDEYTELEEKKNNSESKLEAFLTNPGQKLNFTELFTDKDAARMEKIKNELIATGDNFQNILSESLMDVENINLFFDGKELIANTAIDYGTVSQEVGKELLEYTKAQRTFMAGFAVVALALFSPVSMAITMGALAIASTILRQSIIAGKFAVGAGERLNELIGGAAQITEESTNVIKNSQQAVANVSLAEATDTDVVEESEQEKQEEDEPKSLADYILMVGDESENMGNAAKSIAENNGEEVETTLNTEDMSDEEKLQAYLDKNNDFKEFIEGTKPFIALFDMESISASKTAEGKINASDEAINGAKESLNNPNAQKEEDADAIDEDNAEGEANGATGKANAAGAAAEKIAKDSEKAANDSTKRKEQLEAQGKQYLAEINKYAELAQKNQKAVEKNQKQQLKLQAQITKANDAMSQTETDNLELQATAKSKQEKGENADDITALIAMNVASSVSQQSKLTRFQAKIGSLSTNSNNRIKKMKNYSKKIKAITRKYNLVVKEKIAIDKAEYAKQVAKQKEVNKQIAIVDIVEQVFKVVTTVGSILIATGTVLSAFFVTAAVGAALIAAGTKLTIIGATGQLLCDAMKLVIYAANDMLEGNWLSIAMNMLTNVITLAVTLVTMGAGGGIVDAATKAATKAAGNVAMGIGGIATATAGMASLVSTGADVANDINTIKYADGKMSDKEYERKQKEINKVKTVSSFVSAGAGIAGGAANLTNFKVNDLASWGNLASVAGDSLNLGLNVAQAAGVSEDDLKWLRIAASAISLAGATMNMVNDTVKTFKSGDVAQKISSVLKLTGNITTSVASLGAAIQSAKGEEESEVWSYMAIGGSALSTAGSFVEMVGEIKQNAQDNEDAKKQDKKEKAEKTAEGVSREGIKDANGKDIKPGEAHTLKSGKTVQIDKDGNYFVDGNKVSQKKFLATLNLDKDQLETIQKASNQAVQQAKSTGKVSGFSIATASVSLTGDLLNIVSSMGAAIQQLNGDEVWEGWGYMAISGTGLKTVSSFMAMGEEMYNSAQENKQEKIERANANMDGQAQLTRVVNGKEVTLTVEDGNYKINGTKVSEKEFLAAKNNMTKAEYKTQQKEIQKAEKQSQKSALKQTSVTQQDVDRAKEIMSNKSSIEGNVNGKTVKLTKDSDGNYYIDGKIAQANEIVAIKKQMDNEEKLQKIEKSFETTKMALNTLSSVLNMGLTAATASSAANSSLGISSIKVVNANSSSGYKHSQYNFKRSQSLIRRIKKRKTARKTAAYTIK